MRYNRFGGRTGSCRIQKRRCELEKQACSKQRSLIVESMCCESFNIEKQALLGMCNGNDEAFMMLNMLFIADSYCLCIFIHSPLRYTYF